MCVIDFFSKIVQVHRSIELTGEYAYAKYNLDQILPSQQYIEYQRQIE